MQEPSGGGKVGIHVLKLPQSVAQFPILGAEGRILFFEGLDPLVCLALGAHDPAVGGQGGWIVGFGCLARGGSLEDALVSQAGFESFEGGSDGGILAEN